MNEQGQTALIADIGGTNARFALVDGSGGIDSVVVLPCADFPDLAAAAGAYLERTRPERAPTRAAIALACPITSDQIKMTNLDWEFSVIDTQRRLGLEELRVVNDFTAVALSIPHLAPHDIRRIGGGEAAADSPIAILGPGTGLGVSALVPVGSLWVPLVTEGGHVTMSAHNDREAVVLSQLRIRFGHVSAERVLSGPGLVNLYSALCELAGETPRPGVTPAEVTGLALKRDCVFSMEALAMFFSMLGTVASNMALSMGARGGVYIAGGIVPRMVEAFQRSGFRKRFEDMGRFSSYVAAVPTSVVIHQTPAFLGLGSLVRSGGNA